MTTKILGACVLASVALMACSSTDSTPAPVSEDVEIFSWWTDPGEVDALDALLGVVKANAPKLNVINSAADVHYGTDTHQVLADRLTKGNPPDTFQVHGGAELIDTWVSVNGDDSQNRMETLDFLYKSEDWGKVFPQKLVDVLSYKGHVYSVPMNIHRGNMVFYKKSIFASAHVKIPTTWDEFFIAADAIKAKGKTPVALGGKDDFALGMIFDDAILSYGGEAYYTSFFQGNEKPATDKQVAQAVALMV